MLRHLFRSTNVDHGINLDKEGASAVSYITPFISTHDFFDILIRLVIVKVVADLKPLQLTATVLAQVN
ncbi:hypothetical protein BHE74_00026695 [Ensete ventricosum]|nr:hypothetical protein BHE74_00026695 [Ensete ventricosum]